MNGQCSARHNQRIDQARHSPPTQSAPICRRTGLPRRSHYAGTCVSSNRTQFQPGTEKPRRLRPSPRWPVAFVPEPARLRRAPSCLSISKRSQTLQKSPVISCHLSGVTPPRRPPLRRSVYQRNSGHPKSAKRSQWRPLQTRPRDGRHFVPACLRAFVALFIPNEPNGLPESSRLRRISPKSSARRLSRGVSEPGTPATAPHAPPRLKPPRHTKPPDPAQSAPICDICGPGFQTNPKRAGSHKPRQPEPPRPWPLPSCLLLPNEPNATADILNLSQPSLRPFVPIRLPSLPFPPTNPIMPTNGDSSPGWHAGSIAAASGRLLKSQSQRLISESR